MPTTIRTNPRTWETITTETDLSNLFNEYSTLLAGIGATAQDVYNRMLATQLDAVSVYTTAHIRQIVHNNYVVHLLKYQQLIGYVSTDPHLLDPLYDVENYNSTRTPDLQSHSESTGSGSADTTRNQTRTTTNTPNTTSTTLHEVNPYDNSGLRSETKDTISDSGSTTTVEGYAGNPDHSETSSEAESTVSTTGTEDLEYTRERRGRDGRQLPADVVQSGLAALNMLDIIDIIINDVAEEVFLQLWIY